MEKEIKTERKDHRRYERPLSRITTNTRVGEKNVNRR